MAQDITVNGIKISPDEINAEVQYHPADNFNEAKHRATQALVIREVLIQRAAEIGLCERKKAIRNPDSVIDDLLKRELKVPKADEKTCQHYFDKNKRRFFTSPLFDVSHILYLAPPENIQTKKQAKLKAEKALKEIMHLPERFEQIAKAESACSSAKDSGRLGQISKGQTMPAFEAALLRLKEGEISPEPVETAVGYHIIKVNKRVEGAQLPYESVAGWIKDDLEEKSWNKAFQQYVQLLAGRSKISGFEFAGEKTPLVQ
ncbi:MAG: peptidylprolyl isomerase [Alphaproteobacteria bacterium]|nr:peptidylprolyl isomerase [Alphaproteobacteria bacterium]HPF47561.1 peptidylprolyl isomerase [Emcibacteraceae bacterium]HRW30346.1 peptidylprolyl isomerase [Emcibacteraceae bacterium]